MNLQEKMFFFEFLLEFYAGDYEFFDYLTYNYKTILLGLEELSTSNPVEISNWLKSFYQDYLNGKKYR